MRVIPDTKLDLVASCYLKGSKIKSKKKLLKTRIFDKIEYVDNLNVQQIFILVVSRHGIVFDFVSLNDEEKYYARYFIMHNLFYWYLKLRCLRNWVSKNNNNDFIYL